MFQEIEDYDIKFASRTFKFGFPWDSNGIYNVFTRRTPRTFDDLLARINEFSRVEDDDQTANRSNFKRDRGNGKREGGNGKKNIKDDRENDKKSGSDSFKRVKTIFIKPIHNIMFDI